MRSATNILWSNKNLNDNDLAVMSHIFVSIGSMGALTQLFLNDNQIGDAGMADFSRAIASGSMGSLEELSLSSNQIGDAGMISLSEVIGKGSMGSLGHLFLAGNQITRGTMLSTPAPLKELKRVCKAQGVELSI